MPLSCPKCGSANSDDSRYCRSCATPLPESSADTPTRTLQYDAANAFDDLQPGSLFANRYRIIEELGAGGMGRVLKALDTRTGEKIALKLIRSDVESDPHASERFRHELTAARKISHRNVCRMYDLGEEAGRLYITMEYIAGEDLKSILRMMGTMSPAQAIAIAVQICDGLEEAHRLGIVHRDLKPANVLIDREATARIMDFGIAHSPSNRGVTGVGTLIGTPEYMSPEQAEGASVDSRSDLYSLGVLLFEMTTGRAPFLADTPVAVAVKHATEAPPDPASVRAGVPEELSRIILKCLAKPRDSRYQTAAELRSDLEAIAARLPAAPPVLSRRKATTVPTVTSRFHVARWLLASAVVLIAGAVSLFVLWPRLRESAAPVTTKIPRSVAVVGFDNQTGDPRYDYLKKVIPNLLITDLENAGLFHVATWERMRDVLAQAGRSGIDVVDGDAGFEFSRREGVAFVVVGSFTKAGDTFVTECKLLDADTRKLVASAAARGSGEASILNAHIDDLSRKIAAGIGVAADRLKAPAGVADVTTHSLEAYKAYVEGKEAYRKFDFPAARAALENAVRLDPEFAMAHLSLAYALVRDERPRALEEMEKAKALSGHASEKERLLIEAQYARMIENNAAKSVTQYKELVAKYPRDKEFRNGLGSALMTTDIDAAIAEFRVALQLDPQFGLAMNQLAFALVRKEDYAGAEEQLLRYAAVSPGEYNPWDSLGQVALMRGTLDDARRYYEKARALSPQTGEELSIAYIVALQEDYEAALTWLDRYQSVVPSDGLKADGLGLRGLLLHLIGRRATALQEIERALSTARSAGDARREAAIVLARAAFRCDSGDVAGCRDDYRRVREMGGAVPSAQVVGTIGGAYGDIAARDFKTLDTRMAELERLAPAASRTSSLTAMLNNIEITRLLALGRDVDAIRLSESPQPHEVIPGGWSFSLNILIASNLPFALDGVAQALARRGSLDDALNEYKALMTIGPDTKNRRLVNPVYHLRVAGLYEKKGDKGKAADHYRKFLRLWKNADPGLPQPLEARRRLAALGD